MRVPFIYILLFFSLSGFSQLKIKLNRNLKQLAPITFLGGFADGTNQSYLFHYEKKKFFGIKPNTVAWVNKWAKDIDGNPIVGKERFFGSSTFLVFTTDFHHATRFVENRCNEASGLVYAFGHGAKRKRVIDYVADLSIMFLSRSAGFHTSYSIIFK